LSAAGDGLSADRLPPAPAFQTPLEISTLLPNLPKKHISLGRFNRRFRIDGIPERFIEQVSGAAAMSRDRQSRKACLNLETLERRDAPATLVSPTRVSYQDIDGDNVTVTISKPLLNAGNVNEVFIFDAGSVDGDNLTKQQLRTVDITKLGDVAKGVNITTVATRSNVNGGDGFAALGQIDATGIDLGRVTIDGDLGRVRAGDATTATPGLAGLTVHSMGRYGTSTGSPNLNTGIQGRLDFLVVKSDVKEAFVNVEGAADGRLGSVFIGGSLIGGAGTSSGRILSSGAMGPVRVNGNVQGGGGNGSGDISTVSTLAGVTVGGSLLGGTGNISGRIFSSKAMGLVRVIGDVEGDVQVAGGITSGIISTNSTLAGVTIGGSLLGGARSTSGQISSTGAMGAVRINGSVKGAGGVSSGAIVSASTLAGVRIGGSLVGGSGNQSGRVHANEFLGNVQILGNVVGGAGAASARISSDGKLAGVRIGASLVGGTGSGSGHITSVLEIGPIQIGRDILGGPVGASGEAGAIFALSSVASLTVGGSIIGGGSVNGRIRALGDIGPISVRAT
jgi:hypothetical protein